MTIEHVAEHIGNIYIGKYKIKFVDKVFQVVHVPTAEVVHECATSSEALKVALDKAGLKFAKPAQGKEGTQC